MAFRINHLHLKTPDTRKTVDFYLEYAGAEIVSERTSPSGENLSPEPARRGAQRHGFSRRAEARAVLRTRTRSHRYQQLRWRSGQDQICRNQDLGRTGAAGRASRLLLRRPPGSAVGVFGVEAIGHGVFE